MEILLIKNDHFLTFKSKSSLTKFNKKEVPLQNSFDTNTFKDEVFRKA